MLLNQRPDLRNVVGTADVADKLHHVRQRCAALGQRRSQIFNCQVALGFKAFRTKYVAVGVACNLARAIDGFGRRLDNYRVGVGTEWSVRTFGRNECFLDHAQSPADFRKNKEVRGRRIIIICAAPPR